MAVSQLRSAIDAAAAKKLASELECALPGPGDPQPLEVMWRVTCGAVGGRGAQRAGVHLR